MNKFKVIIPAYNCEQWIDHCLISILDQSYQNYEIVVIDDCSTDETAPLLYDRLLSTMIPDLSFIHNDKRIGSGLANIVKGINFNSGDPEDIIVTIDGDDYLASNDVFSYLNAVYSEDIWMTYGSFLPLSGKYKNTCQPFDRIMTPTKIGNLVPVSVTSQTYRKSGLWCTSHLRTFKRHLWDRIKDEDLRDQSGEYFKVAWDMAFMYPMIEMAGPRVRFIDKILYMYNDLNPNCDGNVMPEEQVRIGEMIQQKEVYGEIDSNIL